MSQWLSDVHFLRPWWLLLAFAWLVLVVAMLRANRSGATWRRLVDAPLLPHLLAGSGKARHGSTWLLALVGVLVTLALAGPAWQRQAQPLYGNAAAQVVVVSLSRRMLARDVTPDRMRRVRYKIHDLLRANAGGRNGLVAYAGEAFVVAPLTNDAHALDDLLDALSPQVMPVPGDAPAKGIRQGAGLLEQVGTHTGSLVLVTDRVDEAAIEAARKVHAEGVRVSVLGVGGDHGVPVDLPGGGLLKDGDGHIVMTRQDAQGLKALARAGGGIYVPMSGTRADIEALKAELRASRQPGASARDDVDQWQDMGPWLLLPVLLLAALAFRRGWLLLLALALLPCVSLPAHAADTGPAPATSVTGGTSTSTKPSWKERWSALWLNPDQRAARALAAGHADKARHLANSPALRGTAAYRAGDYAGAAKTFAHLPGADAAYNLGNALARAGHYRKAIEAYDKALKQSPGMTDAEANRKAVEDWLRQHEDKAGSRQNETSRAGDKSPSRGKRGSSSGRNEGASKSPDAGQGAASNKADGKHGPASKPASPPANAGSGRAPASAASTGDKSQAGQVPNVKNAQAQQAEARAARKAMQERVEAGGEHRPESGHDSFELGRAPAHASSAGALPAPMERALQRVPDDPGGLLKRKFELEYRERQSARDGGGS